MSYVSLVDAAEATGVPYQMIAKMIKNRTVGAKPAGSRSPLISTSDLPLIRSAYFDQPAPGDPTPEEIRLRCDAVRSSRPKSADTIRGEEIVQLLRRRPGQSADQVAAAIGVQPDTAKDDLAALVNCDRVVAAGSPKRFWIASASVNAVGQASAEEILRRFTRNARRHVRNRYRRHLAAA